MKSHVIKAFAFAPMTAAFVEGLVKFDTGAYAFALIGAYPFTATLGIPAYLLLTRSREVSFWRFVALGVVLGALSGLLLALGLPPESSKVARVALCALEGLITAVAIWLIAQCRNPLGGKVQTWIVACMFIGAAGHLAPWTYLYGSWTWIPGLVTCIFTAAAIFVRPAVAKWSILAVAILYSGYWLILGVPGLMAAFRTAIPWQESALAFVPGIGLVLLPAAFCCHVTMNYMPRQAADSA